MWSMPNLLGLFLLTPPTEIFLWVKFVIKNTEFNHSSWNVDSATSMAGISIWDNLLNNLLRKRRELNCEGKCDCFEAKVSKTAAFFYQDVVKKLIPELIVPEED